MKAIWKFPFEVRDIVEIEMPLGAQILHVDEQKDTPCLEHGEKLHTEDSRAFLDHAQKKMKEMTE